MLRGLPLGTELVVWRKCAAVLCSGDPWVVQAAVRCGTPVVSLSFSVEPQIKGRGNGAGAGGSDDDSGGKSANLEALAEASFWSTQIHRCGVGTAPVAAKNVSASGLARVLRRLAKTNPGGPDHNGDARERIAARQFAGTMRSSEGPGGAMDKALAVVLGMARPIAALRSAGARRALTTGKES